MRWIVFGTNDPVGSATYYLLWVLYYFICFNAAEFIYWDYPDKAGLRSACMDGIHLELQYAFTSNYGDNIIFANSTATTTTSTCSEVMSETLILKPMGTRAQR